ncbi:MAG: insulinase family protein [Chloroflexi bacterium]|nr:insulinase family protein [Chloroflexota bacterium]
MATNDFELVREQTIPELNTRAKWYRHVKTGAQVLSMENDDENKVFGITFATPPTDSTGLPHILEHSVLCGSRKYPVKEPFVELVKGSLNTFLNAMTYPDKTCYPVASQNLQDFYNLIDVYLDAVFYPRITPEVLMQEGWHYELESADKPLAFKGVVFNEMKGAYSSPDNILYRYTQQSLFPDNAYGVDSGGDPKHIPDLTYENFKSFHQTYYHPSNALIYFYGDDDPAKRLQIIQDYLKDFERIQVDARIRPQPRFGAPKQLVYGYDAGALEGDGAPQKKGFVTINWMFTDGSDVTNSLALAILSHILVGTPASPLRKALIDSGLGEDLTGGGLEDELRNLTFSTGLKGIAVEDAGKVEALILDTLAKLARDGIDREMVEASLNTIEFRLRENNTGSYPRGLIFMLNALSTWLHGDDPMARLAFEAPLNTIKQNLAGNPRYFESLIEQHFLNNPHRTQVLLKPDPEVRARDEAEERARLDQARATMTDPDVECVVEETRRLKELQSTPDSPEALATIPMLKLADIDKENKPIPLEVSEAQGAKLLYHDLFTNGITYLDLGFDLRKLPQEYLPYVTLFGRALLEMGTETEDFVKLSQRIGRKTGGIHPASFTATVNHDSAAAAAWLFLRGKATVAQSRDLLDILKDVLLTAKLDNRDRFRQMVLEAKAGQETGLVPGGHRVVNTRLRARFSQADWASEQMGGASNLFFLRQLAEQVEHNWPAVLEKLEAIRSHLLARNNMVCNVTLDQPNWQSFQPALAAFIAQLPTTTAAAAPWTPVVANAPEGLTIPAQVNYVGKGTNLYKFGYQLNGSILVISNLLRTTWLWERIRVQGGAYGGFCLFDHRSGTFTFVSYRDPNLLGTLDNYDNTGEFLRGLKVAQDEVTKSIIGVIGDLDAYQLPDAKGYTSMLRHLAGETDANRQRLRDQVLATTAQDFTTFAAILDQVKQQGAVVVLGSEQAITAAEAERRLGLQVTKVL